MDGGDAVGTGVVPISIFENQPDPPLLPREAYPAWLWTLLDKQPTLKELAQKYERHGESGLNETEAKLDFYLSVHRFL